MILNKPAYGDPCNGCGLCCMATQCAVSLMVFGEHDLCPALGKSSDGRYRCGLVSAPDRFFPQSGDVRQDKAVSLAVGFLIGAGRGCDARLVDEPARPEVEERFKVRDDDEPTNQAAQAAIALLASVTKLLGRKP